MRYNAHTRYELKDGTYIVGVTTVTGLLNKPVLYNWYNKLGLQNIVGYKYVDELADIGTYAHRMIECSLKDIPMPSDVLKDYSTNHKEQAGVCFNKYLNWKLETQFKPIKLELKLVSEQYKYGGTLDIYGTRHGKKTLIDVKTGSAIYPEHFTQVSAYRQLLIEHGYEVEDCRILRIGRNENEGFEDRPVPNVDLHFERFKHLLKVYNTNKALGL